MRQTSFMTLCRKMTLVAVCLLACGCGVTTSASHPGATSSTSTTTTTTAAATPTAAPTATSLPVPTPTTLANYPPFYPVAPFAKIMLGNATTHQNATFFPDAIAPDGTKALAVEGNINFNYPGPSGVLNWAIGVGWLSIPGGGFTAITVPGATFSKNYSYGIQSTGVYDVIEQFPCGGVLDACTAPGQTASKAWVYTNSARVVFPDVPLTPFVDHDIIIANDPVHGLEAANLATNTLTSLPGTVSPTSGTLGVLAFAWPYLVYSVHPFGAQLAGYAYDLQTQTDVPLPQIASALRSIAPNRQAGFAIATGSDTLFIAYADTAANTVDLDELDHVMHAGNTVPILREPGIGQIGVTITGANAQMVTFFDSEGRLWDRQNHHIYTLYGEDGPAFAYGIVSGSWFGVVDEIGGGAGFGMGSDPFPITLEEYASSGVPK